MLAQYNHLIYKIEIYFSLWRLLRYAVESPADGLIAFFAFQTRSVRQ